MAEPQKENGHVGIANEIIEALAKVRIPGEANQVLWAIFRKTYGWNKKEDRISLSQFQDMTGLGKVAICKGINKLITMNIVTKKGNATSLFTKKGNDTIVSYSIQKDHDKWRTLPKKVTCPQKTTKESDVTNIGNVEAVNNNGKHGYKKDMNIDVTQKGNDDTLPKKVTYVTQKGNDTLPKKVTTKNTITKNTITKTSSKVFADNSVEVELSKLLLSLIRERDPEHKQPNIQQWAYSINLLIRKDSRDPPQIESVLRWCQGHDFWKNNILCTDTFREKYGKLFLQMKEDASNNGKRRNTFAQSNKTGANEKDYSEGAESNL